MIPRPSDTPVPHVWEKLDRADKHIEELSRLIADYTSDASRVASDPDTDRFNEFLRTHNGRPTPDIFGVIAGEVFYQWRSALDNLVCAFIIFDGATPSDKSQFPIREHQIRDKDARRRYEGQIKGIGRNSVREFIEGLQPYNTRNTHGLRLLIIRDKCNRDKHRSIDIQSTSIAGSIEFDILGRLEVSTVRRRGGTTQQTIEVPLAQKKANVSLRTLVVFKDWPMQTKTAVEVVPALTDLSTFVRGILAIGENHLRHPASKRVGTSRRT